MAGDAVRLQHLLAARSRNTRLPFCRLVGFNTHNQTLLFSANATRAPLICHDDSPGGGDLPIVI